MLCRLNVNLKLLHCVISSYSLFYGLVNKSCIIKSITVNTIELGVSDATWRHIGAQTGAKFKFFLGWKDQWTQINVSLHKPNTEISQ